MPNPFPGMNPYLENPLHWRGIHNLLLSYIHVSINQRLPDAFVVRAEERIPGNRTMREAFLEIRTVDDASDLIAVIEVLSPSNKMPGPGRDEYKRKQKDVKNSLVHLVEIDLLRDGAYTVAPDERGTRARAGHFDYICSLHRGGEGENFEVWPIPLRQQLPRISIPLTEEVNDITLDLQAVLSRIYDDGLLGKGIRYDLDPNPPLTGEDAEWADALLRLKGLR